MANEAGAAYPHIGDARRASRGCTQNQVSECNDSIVWSTPINVGRTVEREHVCIRAFYLCLVVAEVFQLDHLSTLR